MGSLGPRRYPLTGGWMRWRVAVAATLFTLVAVWAQEWTAVAAFAVLGLLVWEMDRAPVLELSRHGLARGFALPGGALVGASVVPWRVIDVIETRWLRPHDRSALETIVRGPGGAVRFTSHMGLRAHRRILRELQRRAPQAQHVGLTDEILRAPAARRRRWPVRMLLQGLLALAGLLALWL
jgi:hypothetical protein